MARAELRAAVAGAPDEEQRAATPSARKRAVKPEKDLDNAKTQAAILQPPEMTFKAAGKTLHVPLEFTVGDVIERGILEDIDAYVRLVGVELGRISPELQSAGLGVLQEAPGYLEAALMRSGVRRSVRDLLQRIAYYHGTLDGRDTKLRPSVADLETLRDVDYLVCAIRIYTDALKRMVAAKNAARTASA